MTTTLATAQAALQLSSTVLSQVGESPSSEKQHSTSIVDHWPVVTSGISFLITTINAIVLGILGNITVTVFLGIAAVGCGVLTIYLWSIPSLKHLETYVADLALRVNDLARVSKKLLSANSELSHTRNSLEQAIAERAELMKRQEVETQTLLSRLNKANKDFQRSEANVAQMGAILDGSRTVVTEMSSKIGSFVALNKNISASSQLLTGELSSLKAIGNHLDSAVEQLDKENKALLERKQQADTTAHLVYDRFMQIAELLVGLKQEREKLQADLSSLKTANTSLMRDVEALHAAAKDLGDSAASAHTVAEQLQPFVELSKALQEKLKKRQESQLEPSKK